MTATGMDDLAFAAHEADVRRESAREVDFQFERGEAPARRRRRVDRAAERRVEERRREAAVRDAGAVVKALVDTRREDNAAVLDLDEGMVVDRLGVSIDAHATPPLHSAWLILLISRSIGDGPPPE